MKILIASDIHGSALYCERLMTAAEREKADKILLLGDLLYHGPRNDLPEGYAPKKVIEMLSAASEKITCVRGNCEAEVDQMVLPFPVMADYCILDSEEAKGRRIFATHGHHFNPETPPQLRSGDILLNGHTHVPACRDCGDFLYVNPGSVSIPKDGSEHSYLILENGRLSWKDLDGKIYMEHTL